jgi:hypothetical protein
MKFELEKHSRNNSEEVLIADLKRVSRQIGKSPTIDEYNERGAYHATTITRRFGGWFKALEKANLEKTRSLLNTSEEDLFKNLEEVWTRLGRQPRYRDVQKPLSKYSAGTYDKRFGSFGKALEAFVNYMDGEEVDIAPREYNNISTRHNTKRDINWRLRYLVMRKDNFRCKNCGRSPATDSDIILHVDHIKAWANGGETVLENLQTLCAVCNIGKSDLE